jgi:hypothetical protein
MGETAQKAMGRRKSTRGVKLVDENMIKQTTKAVDERTFQKELPSSLELKDFYSQNKLPSLTQFSDIPEQFKETFMIINLARTQPQLFAKSYLEKFRMRYTSSQSETGRVY